jgi:hypothetical protein
VDDRTHVAAAMRFYIDAAETLGRDVVLSSYGEELV